VLDDGYLGGLVVSFQDTTGVDGVLFYIPESSGYSIDENFKAVLHFYRLCDSLTGQHLMCNLYSITKSQTAIIEFTRAMKDSTGNLPPMPGIFPDYRAPVVANKDGLRELCMMRWGMPSSQLAQMQSAKKRAGKLDAKGKSYDFKELLRMEPDSGTTNIRNAGSKHWKRWLGVENRCVVPFTSFSEFNKAEGGDIWFALDDGRPLAVFAGIWTNWTSVRKVKEGETTNDLFGFLTTEPNDVVGAIHPKAMPVILTKPEEIEAWLTSPTEEALKLQRALPDGVLKVVARGRKKDGES
jgi:putative SOS response-associated peptidase YedK